ncbi:MAG TPA: chromosome segregation protein SMC [Ktedonobacter sp.]|nr:chromosome segregation protein SMC [Ktedonobacter sp.]
MYLKRLEMLGFKSFALKTSLEFSTGITAVVGPNGAGKSNVADGMRWVLGEQSMRQLRGKKSDDIIFAGGHGKAALGLAEVSLTLDNSTGWVPSEYSEITVTRRSYRSGENEYLINKQKVRLKDVVLLLAQARIGHDSYTVVGQGSIDAALSLRAEERRGFFEDAAGIRPFQVQRTDAENRLRQTEQNVERLRDIVGEIEPRLGPLEEQARRAVEFRQLNGELQEVLLTWYALQWRRLHTASERAEAAEQEQAQKVRDLELAMQSADEQGKNLRGKRQQALARIAECRKAYGEANDLVQKIERDLAVSEERVVGLTRQCSDQQQEERRLREQLIALQQRVIDQEEQCDSADEDVDTNAASIAALEQQVTRAQKDYEADERRLRTAQNEFFQVQARLGASQTDLGRQQKQLGERNRTLAARRESIAQAQQSLRSLETHLVEERSRLDTARKEEQQVAQRKQALGRAIADAQQEFERLKSAQSEAERQRRTVSDRLNMLKNWRQSLSGYTDGVRALLRAPAAKVSGLVGPVPQLGVAPSGLEIAIEAALGPYLQAVVVQTYRDAQNCLLYLQTAKLGKAMVVWMEGEQAGEKDYDERLQVPEETIKRFLEARPILKERVVGFAWRSMQCEPRYLPLFRTMLRGVVLVRDVEAARELMAWVLSYTVSDTGDLPIEMVVTGAGEVLHHAGWLAAGSGKEGSQQGLLTYERELHELPGLLSEHVALIDQLNSMISEVQRAQEGRRIEQSAVDRELQKILARVNELNRVVMTTQREQEHIQTELRLADSLEQQLAAEVVGLEQEVQAAQERVRVHEKSQREMAGLVEELQHEMEERATVFRRQQDELGRGRTAVAVKRQEARSLRQQLDTLQLQAQEHKAQVEQQRGRIKETEQQQQVLVETINSRRRELEEVRAKSHTLGNELNLAEEQASEIERQVGTLEQQTTQLRQAMTGLEGGYRRCLLESQKTRDAVDSLLEQLREEMGVMDPKELNNYAAYVTITPGEAASQNDQFVSEDSGALSEEEEAYLRKLRRRVDSLRGRLKVLGGCDPDAPQQYEEIRTRFEFLSTQIADMEQAASHLRSIIGQLDVTMARQFEATFQAVNARFREHFITLFNGGNARLELTDAKTGEDDSDKSVPAHMPAGVEVIVQPPGKKVQDLSLLSGGERALVSAALLFALLEINPPPFCLLDEVDAALDESNVVRFCDILKRLAQRTQFIMITHNRVTMTSAQVIYGVSMGGDSISRLLSMKLEEAPVAGDR